MGLSFETKRFLARSIRWSALIGFATGAANVVGTAIAYAPPEHGWGGANEISTILMGLVLMLSCTSFFIGCFVVLFPPYRWGAAMILGPIIVGILVLLTMPLADRIQNQRLRAMTLRAEPLIAAIESYELKHGTPPGTLDQLAPEFISEIPNTGIAISPKYGYLTEIRGGKDRWKLGVRMPGFSGTITITNDPKWRWGNQVFEKWNWEGVE